MTDTAEIERLAAEAAADEMQETAAQAPMGETGTIPTPGQIDHVTEARGVIDVAAETAIGFLPKLARVYTAETRQRLAEAWGPIMAMYGWTLGGLFSNPWFNAAVVTIPVAAQTYAVVKEAEAEAEAQQGGNNGAEQISQLEPA